MKYKKKQGSSLVLVIAIVGVLVTVGAVVCSAVLNTTRLNESVKVTDDLKYAAESGVERAMSKIVSEKKVNPNWEPLDVADKNIEITKTEFNSNKIRIKVGIEQLKDNAGVVKQNHYRIISKAINDNGKEEVVKATIGQNYGNESIFKNVMCADSISMSGGSINARPNPINIRNEDNVVGGNIDKVVTKYAFTLPNFTFGEMKESDKTFEVSNINEILMYLDSKVGNGVVKIELELSHPYSGKYPVYLVNSNEITIKFKGGANSGGNFIILTNGDIKFEFLNSGSLNLSRASIIGKKLDMGSNGSITFNYAPQGPDGNNPLKDSDIEKLNKEIAKHSSNWHENGSTGSGSVDYWGTIDYEY